MTKQALRVAFGFLMLRAAVLHARIRIEITQGVGSARPIDVVPFQWAGPGAAPEDIGGIVGVDLHNSDKFDPLDRFHPPQRPGTTQEVQPTAWSTLGIDAIIVGQVTLNSDGSYSIAYQPVGTSSVPGTVLAQNTYKVNEQWLHCAGHITNDEVFEKLTDTKDAFRTCIVYIIQTSDGQFPYELHVSDYDGYNQFVVHHSPQPLMSPAWSPDGSKLVYVTLEGGRSALVIQTLSNGAARQVASFPHHNGAPTFPSDGSKLAFALPKANSLNLYIMDTGSGWIRQVMDGRNNDTEPIWFPGSQSLAFTSGQAGHPRVHKANVNGGIPRRITWEGSQNRDADANNGGRLMVMVSSANGQQHITKQDLVAGSVQILSSTFPGEAPSLAPSSTVVIYSSSQKMGSVLSLVSTDGHFRARLPATDGQVKFPAWSPYL